MLGMVRCALAQAVWGWDGEAGTSLRKAQHFVLGQGVQEEASA